MYPALDAAGIARRGPYQLRHTFATEALAAWRLDLPTVATDGRVGQDDRQALRHVARDSEEHLRGLLAAFWRFDAEGKVIGMIIVNLRFLLERDGELKITWPEANVPPEEFSSVRPAAA